MQSTWFITGTSSGFGRILTERLLERGDRVAATLRDPSVLADPKARYGDRLWLAALDVTDGEAVRRVVDGAFADLGHIDVVVNNAGYGLFGAIEELADDEILRQIDTNIVGSLRVVRAALPHLRAQGGGRILQLSSMGGQMAFPGFGLYHTTKWAVEGFCEALAQEVAPFGIGVTLIEPGSARTDFGSRSIRITDPTPAYDATAVGDLRRAWAAGAFPVPGDPKKMVDAMIAAVEAEVAPRRVALGSDAYTSIRAALVDRLAALDAQKDIALSTDA